jgi:hypothetical protein
MPTFIKIAPQRSNQSGITSKGSIICRTGKTVIMKWGAIVSINRKFYWAGHNLPQVKHRKFRTIVEAENHKNERILRRSNKNYQRLPSGQSILKYKKT